MNAGSTIRVTLVASITMTCVLSGCSRDRDATGADAMLDRIRSELNQQAARQPAGNDRATLSPIARAAHERLMRDGVLKLCESPKASFTISVNPGSIYSYVNCNSKERREDWKRN